MTSADADGGPAVVVNAGSSTMKVRVIGPHGTTEGSLDIDPWDGGAAHPELARFLDGVAGAVAVVGHRVVHGGTRFSQAVLIDEAVIGAIAGLADLAPLHQPRALAGIDAARNALPGVPQIACFDTAFHAGLPAAAARYALPDDWTRRFGLRRFGFHGLSHGYAARRAAELLGRDLADLRLVTCHLGAGASLAAVRDGRSVDTTMGFTPLEGLVMATRSGSVDPGLITWLLQHGSVSVDELAAGLELSAGLAGLAQIPSGDMRAVLAAADSGDEQASLALEVYLHRLRREIAAMTAAMNGLDALVFTGGVGEHSPRVRALTAAGLEFLGVSLDPAQRDVTSDADISGPGQVRVLVVTAREDLEIALQARAVLAAPHA
ncbi:MAG: acetate/propionate family kinase [Actinobacteria bacterium]|nr:acetate/propionate family kinase [Actinomycetota bacterium]